MWRSRQYGTKLAQIHLIKAKHPHWGEELSSDTLSEEYRLLSQAEKSFYLAKFTGVDTLYRRLMTNLGFVVLFITVFPVTPLMAMVCPRGPRLCSNS